MYRASVTVYVNNIRGDQYVEYITNSNLATAQRLVNTYVNIIKSDSVLEKVADTLDQNVSASQIRAAMSAAQMDDTEIFTVTITHADPEMAAQIANAVAEVAPREIETYVEGSSTKIIDYAKTPQSPSSPNVTRNTLLGAIVGCLAALVYIALRFLMDVRIKDEEELNMLFNLPVLAQIPAFHAESKNRSSYGKRGYSYASASISAKGGDQE